MKSERAPRRDKPGPRREKGDRSHRRKPAPETPKELKYYGRAACEALFRRRPADIIRIYIEKELIPVFSDLLKWAAAARKAYHLVGGEELEKITESVHHQGICVLARERLPLSLPGLLARLKEAPAAQLLAYMDGVENPHNLGAIVRTCAHFGVRYVLGARGRLPRLSPSACRVAEGGAEEVDLVMLDRPLADLGELAQQGWPLLATAVNRGTSLYGFRFPPRAILALGAEVEGISAGVEQAAGTILRIAGTGTVESLNVGVAFGVIVSEYFRQRLGV